MNKDTGGPAFPLHAHEWHKKVSDAGYLNHDFTMGMTLRDYFAATALQVMYEVWEKHEDWGYEEVAERSYVMADAMLKAREK